LNLAEMLIKVLRNLQNIRSHKSKVKVTRPGLTKLSHEMRHN